MGFVGNMSILIQSFTVPHRKQIGFLVSCLLVSSLLSAVDVLANSIKSSLLKPQKVIGYLEKVEFSREHFNLRAKIDSGADQSSIHAFDSRLYKKHGENWVKFKVIDERGQLYSLDKKIVRHVYIKRKSLPSQKRIVVKLGVCISDVYKKVEVNLANRTNFRHLMLVGRSFLGRDFLIDSSKQYLSQPNCK